MRKIQITVILCLVAIFAIGCQGKRSETAPDVTAIEVNNHADIAQAESEMPGEQTAPAAHDPSNPPIDCPLHKAGMDPTKVKPFEETEQYIAFLEREDREIWQKPQDVVAALGLNGAERVFDIGAGSGYFSFPMAAQLTQGGRVYAGDPDPAMVMHVHHKSMLESIQNIEASVIDAEKPELPPDIDVVFMCDVLHHVGDRVVWLTHIANQMKKGSRFYMIEFREGDIPKGPPESAKIPKDQLIKDGKQAGLKFNREIENILPYQYFLEFEK